MWCGIAHAHRSKTRIGIHQIHQVTSFSAQCKLATMNSDQFAKYLELVDHPIQLPLLPDVTSLFTIYREHVTRFPYQNIDLYHGKPMVDLSICAILETLPVHGGHCFQQSELLFAVLEHVGFKVERVAAWVLMGNQYQEGMPLNHNILLVKIGEDTFLCDPGLASASPRYSFNHANMY